MSKIVKNTVKRANTLNESHYRLKEVTQRVLALAIEQAQEIKQLTGQDLIKSGTNSIGVADYYAQVYGVDKDTAYSALKVAMEDLYQAEYHWKELDQDGNINEYRTRFVSHIGYLGGRGAVEFCLTEQARNHILNLTQNFTWYEIRQLSQLGKYSIRLYEILCQYRSTGTLVIGIDELRNRFGLLPNEYEYLGNFKARVLDFAIGEVLKFTDIQKLEYEQEKQGRTIVAFKFSFKFKARERARSKNLEHRDPNTIDFLDNLTDKERQIADSKLSWADQQGIKDPAHRQNLVKQGIDRHRQAQQVEQERKAQAKADAQAKAEAEQADLLIAGQVYAELLQADDEVIEDFLIANKRFLTAGAEKYHFDRCEYRLCLQAMKFRFERLSEFKLLDLSML